jgi:hypothetical protein
LIIDKTSKQPQLNMVFSELADKFERSGAITEECMIALSLSLVALGAGNFARRYAL